MLLAQCKRKFGILCVYLDDMKERRTIKNKKKAKRTEKPQNHISERSELLAVVSPGLI